jgi:hypothetical protein
MRREGDGERRGRAGRGRAKEEGRYMWNDQIFLDIDHVLRRNISDFRKFIR